MNIKPFSTITLYFSILGIWLSGYLSYQTLFLPAGCGDSLITCGGDPVKFLGVPQCVLGFVMFLAVAVIAVIQRYTTNLSRWVNVQLWLAVAGTLFAAGLSTYELWFQKPAPTVMPSCVFGFFLYLGVLITMILAQKVIHRTEAPPPPAQ